MKIKELLKSKSNIVFRASVASTFKIDNVWLKPKDITIKNFKFDTSPEIISFVKENYSDFRHPLELAAVLTNLSSAKMHPLRIPGDNNIWTKTPFSGRGIKAATKLLLENNITVIKGDRKRHLQNLYIVTEECSERMKLTLDCIALFHKNERKIAAVGISKNSKIKVTNTHSELNTLDIINSNLKKHVVEFRGYGEIELEMYSRGTLPEDFSGDSIDWAAAGSQRMYGGLESYTNIDRKSIRINGKKAEYVDFSQSQVTIAANLFNCSSDVIEIESAIQTLPARVNAIKAIKLARMPLMFSDSLGLAKNAFWKNNADDLGLTRSECDTFIVELYNSNKHLHNIFFLKAEGANLLQKMEAQIVKNVTVRIIMEHNMFVATIHDAFAFVEGEYELIAPAFRKYVDEEMIKLFGVNHIQMKFKKENK